MSLQLKALRMTMRALELTAPRLGAALWDASRMTRFSPCTDGSVEIRRP